MRWWQLVLPGYFVQHRPSNRSRDHWPINGVRCSIIGRRQPCAEYRMRLPNAKTHRSSSVYPATEKRVAVEFGKFTFMRTHLSRNAVQMFRNQRLVRLSTIASSDQGVKRSVIPQSFRKDIMRKFSFVRRASMTAPTKTEIFSKICCRIKHKRLKILIVWHNVSNKPDYIVIAQVSFNSDRKWRNETLWKYGPAFWDTRF